jgi:hypothetical protein
MSVMAIFRQYPGAGLLASQIFALPRELVTRESSCITCSAAETRVAPDFLPLGPFRALANVNVALSTHHPSCPKANLS